MRSGKITKKLLKNNILYNNIISEFSNATLKELALEFFEAD
jgi:hypothetical protein